MEQRISLITLGVADLAKAIEFYENVVGWEKSPGPPEIAFFDLNGFVFGLYPDEELAKETDQSAETATGYQGFALAYNVAGKEEVDAVLAELRDKGATIVKEPEEQFWGGYSGYFADPDGHKWEVAYNPFWTLAADGNVSTATP
jgi:uncharacterized glyoxalase superfamily protein PhnB